MGGTTSLWTGSNIPFTLMGEYFDYGYGEVSIWGDEIYSHNFKDYTYTTYDGGVYYGYIGGIAQKGTSSVSLEGSLIAMYIDPNQNAGYLIGNMTGTGYPDVEMFEMDGTLDRVFMATTGTSPIGFDYSGIHYDYFYLYGSGKFSGGGSITLD